MNTTDPVRVETLIETMARPEQVALIFAGRRWSYRELRAESERRAAVLAALHLPAGAVVATAAAVTDDLILAFLACCRAGLVLLPLSPQFTPPELQQLARLAQPSLMLTADGLPHPALPVPLLRPLALPDGAAPGTVGEPLRGRPSTNVEAPAAIRATSGTTGSHPRLVVMPHRQLTWRRGTRAWWETAAGVYYQPLPHHLTVLDICQVFGIGATLVISHATTPARWEAEMAAAAVTAFYGVPTQLHLLAQAQQPVPANLRLTALRSSAAPIPSSLQRTVEQRYAAPAVQLYGSTEGGYVIATPQHGTPAESIGLPLPGTDVRLVNPQGEDVPTGEVGELIVRTPGMMLGYLHDPAATAATLRAGWLWSGDLARRDPLGFYYLEGRRSLRINVGGFKVAPEEIEAVLAQHPCVREVAVTSRPDAARGEVVCAVVVSQGEPPRVSELRRFCRERLAGYKVPRQFEFRQELPRSPLGKVLRQRL